MDCQRVRDQLSAYADGELSPSEHRSVERHLGRCEACHRENAGIRGVGRLTGMIPEVDVPAELHSRIMSRVTELVAPGA